MQGIFYFWAAHTTPAERTNAEALALLIIIMALVNTFSVVDWLVSRNKSRHFDKWLYRLLNVFVLTITLPILLIGFKPFGISGGFLTLGFVGILVAGFVVLCIMVNKMLRSEDYA